MQPVRTEYPSITEVDETFEEKEEEEEAGEEEEEDEEEEEEEEGRSMERGEDDSEGDPEDEPELGRSPPCSVYHAPRRTGVPMRYPPSGLYLRPR